MKTVITGLRIPFIGTSAGAACVFFLKNNRKLVEYVVMHTKEFAVQALAFFVDR